jgi:predicted AlkP superfamily phosphohydrolase/phosphomutase
MSARVLIIGLDGASHDIVTRLLHAGQLPNLSRLTSEGVNAKMHSTFPASSAPAWSSCRTGVNPGKHGIFGFWQREGYQWSLQTSYDLKVPSIERILSRRGRRVCLINVPLTFPPSPVNGIVISGMPTPGVTSSYTFPSELRAELLSSELGYSTDGFESLEDISPAKFLKRVYRRHEQRIATSLSLYGRERWDLFMVVFTLADKIQHCFWRSEPQDQDGRSFGTSSEHNSTVEKSYIALDAAVGAFLGRIGEETTVLVVSDHGFGSCTMELSPNIWLREHGFFHMHTAHKVRARSLSWTRRAGVPLPIPKITLGPPHRRVSWRNTRAFSDLFVEPFGIYLNLKGREPAGTVSEGKDAEHLLDSLQVELMDSRLPQGLPLFRTVKRSHECYHGAFADNAPDIVLDLYDPSIRLSGEFISSDLFSRPGGWPAITGSHRPTGILFASGPSIAAGSLSTDARLIDVAPTVLCLLNEDVPSYMDGRQLFE